MGALNFIWDLSQSGQIAELNERIEKLEEQVIILKEWVDYLEAERKKHNDTTS